jgi:hypothetical protein
VLDGGFDGQRHAPAVLSPEKGPGIYCAGCWVDLRAGLGGSRDSGHSSRVSFPDHPARNESLYLAGGYVNLVCTLYEKCV